MRYKIEILQGKSGYYWRIKSFNGKILAHSETYKTKKSAQKVATNLFSNLDQASIKDLTI